MAETWFGIKREDIDWFPTINYERCTGCMACVKKCPNGVYGEKKGKPKVVNPKKCVVGCTGCHSICPVGAISHPSKEYLKKLAKRKDFKAGCIEVLGTGCPKCKKLGKTGVEKHSSGAENK